MPCAPVAPPLGGSASCTSTLCPMHGINPASGLAAAIPADPPANVATCRCQPSMPRHGRHFSFHSGCALTAGCSDAGHRPDQRSRPTIVYRKIQDLEPPAVTFNQSPAPSPCMPASLIRLACNCVNLFAFTIRLSSTEMEAHFALVIRNRIRKKQKIVRYSMSQLETNKIITHCFLLKKL